jgi:hypothetical protein
VVKISRGVNFWEYGIRPARCGQDGYPRVMQL